MMQNCCQKIIPETAFGISNTMMWFIWRGEYISKKLGEGHVHSAYQ